MLAVAVGVTALMDKQSSKSVLLATMSEVIMVEMLEVMSVLEMILKFVSLPAVLKPPHSSCRTLIQTLTLVLTSTTLHVEIGP